MQKQAWSTHVIQKELTKRINKKSFFWQKLTAKQNESRKGH